MFLVLACLSAPLLYLVCVAPVASAQATESETVTPDEVPGLVAWYDGDSLRGNRDGGAVRSWTDRSGNGHDLKLDEGSPPALFRASQLNGEPTVNVRKSSFYSVTEPFELDDHTIFIVYKTQYVGALFRDDTEKTKGLMLRVDGRYHHYRNGGIGKDGAYYNAAMPLDSKFSITVLGKERGILRSFINGVDVSSGAVLSQPIRVGKFFDLTYSQFVSRDGAGLQLAEILFYDRFLSDTERDALTRYLGEQYALESESAGVESYRTVLESLYRSSDSKMVRLGTAKSANLNDAAGAGVRWEVQTRLDSPFSHDPEKDPTHLHCSADGTRVRLFVSLPVRSTVPGVRLRALLLKNGEEYLPEEAETEVFGGEGESGHAVVELGTTLFLDSGDKIEVVAFADGADGEVTLVASKAVLMAQAW